MAERKEPLTGDGELPMVSVRAVPATRHDAVLQSRIVDRIRTSPEPGPIDLNVVVRNRSATLFGTVQTEMQRSLIAALALSISGVLEVNNRLRVQAPTH